MPSDFWPFPRHFTARSKSEARWLGEAQGAAAAGEGLPALLISLAVQISRKRSNAGRSRRVPDPRHRNEFPAQQSRHHPARLGFGEDIAFRTPNDQRRAGDAAQRRAVIGAGVIGKGTGHFSKQGHRQLADG